ncbi:MAG: conditioned medium factor [Chloroflexi bacterium]|nr:conditioned medium factor [Chloroflexota bacterium]MCI0578310.1 conditioned medium factor [Chloroflexota bacterium]MCI0649022.1 conditioned medium factor [Chloroflexota bacterium]MCI0729457.1 conditioned medium factor [Chloroflexota bacterium]
MKQQKLVIILILLAALFTAASSWAAPAAEEPAGLQTKQIAAPPEEFLSGQLQLPDPAASGIRSTSAMLPVHLAATGGAWTWSGEAAVDATENVSLMVFAPQAAGWQVTVTLPGGRQIDLAGGATAAGVRQRASDLGLGENRYPGTVYTFARPASGVWQIQVTAGGPRQGLTGPDGYLLLSGKSPYHLFTHLSSHELLAGRQLGLVTYLTYEPLGSGQGVPAPLTGHIRSAEMRLVAPDGTEQSLPMFDDGQHADGPAGDGVFGGLVEAALAGQYTAQVTVQGETPAGLAFLRTTEHVFPVIEPALTLAAGQMATAAAADDTRLRIELAALPAAGETGGNVQLFAELWGTDGNGEATPVAWVGGIVRPEEGPAGLVLPLILDGRWIALAGAGAPFELRQVRVHDLQTHVPLALAANIPLEVSSLPAAAGRAVTEVTEEMLMGGRPAAGPGGRDPQVDRRLMLVHGYCSGGVWPTADFTQYAVFQDFNQNRTHDQFAQLIGSYGDQFDSFGVVAHSQGGAASLHLYTYYWSGLDYSSGSRLIQSVGTPYRGTSLAGNLALLGQIFGIGCGTNWDLTYDGAALWLSGIPSWARSRVYYFTTSFTDLWYRYDYCHLGSDLFLSDPDDGATERWAGQLSGANNMGHKTGWCHTTGMRDPAQYNDYNRNANMNTYANR